VVYHAVESVQTLCDSRQQQLFVTLPKTPVYVTGDPTRLAQIVGNLLNNASKFTHCGGHIFLTVERDDEAGSATGDVPQDGPPHVLIRVRDTGRGIAADQLSRIFDLFGQVDTTLERSTDGLGIGLTLVRALAHMHGGTVDANSAGLDCGSEFIVRLPMLVETPIEAAAPIVREPAVALAPLRILVVDDNRDAADMLATLLRLDGHDTQAVHDGRDAVDATLKSRPDLVLLDIGLPRLSGYDVARIIREQGTHADCPFLVAVTGWGQTEDRRRTQEAGFDAHLVKPVSEVALRALVANVGSRIQQREMPA
ncbi:MAG TPA: ATP-binding protein, partial [Vicinamibacterales bacterium]|nr:ATP-binding protein [Vicinamibacterales bacterium]